MGAAIGFELALNHASRVNKLVLNTASPITRNLQRPVFEPFLKSPDSLRILTEASLGKANERTIRTRLEWLMATPDRVADELVALRLKYFSMPEIQAAQSGVPATGSERRPYDDDLEGITVPTLVFWTEFNPDGGPDRGEYLARHIPGAEYYCMMDAAHWPQYEHPQEHDRVVTKFLKQGGR